MPSLNKSLAWLTLMTLCGLSVVPLFVLAVTLPFIPGCPLLFGSLGLGVLVGFKWYPALSSFRVELYKRNGLGHSTKSTKLKRLKTDWKLWRYRVITNKDPADKLYALKRLVEIEEQIADVKGIVYEKPETLRG